MKLLNLGVEPDLGGRREREDKGGKIMVVYF